MASFDSLADPEILEQGSRDQVGEIRAQAMGNIEH